MLCIYDPYTCIQKISNSRFHQTDQKHALLNIQEKYIGKLSDNFMSLLELEPFASERLKETRKNHHF